jgi:site-specific DNA recombinase
VSVTQQFNTTNSMGRLTLNVLLSFAQFEREIIGERIRDKIAAQRRKGKWTGGSPILGYDVDRSSPSPKLVVNAEEAARVRDIFALYLKAGSLLQTADELERRGWQNKTYRTKLGTTHQGKPFDKWSLYSLLTNPLYVGKVKYCGEIHAGEQQPIIAPDLFEKVQTLLKYNGRTGGIEARNKYGALLRGLLYCKACGRAMVHTFTSGGKGRGHYRYYTCTQAIKRGWKKCPAKSLPAAEIERVVVEQVRCIGKAPEFLGEILSQAHRQTDADLKARRTEQSNLAHELARHHDEVRRLAAGAATSETAARLADLHDRIQKAERRTTQLKVEIQELDRDRVGKEDVAAAMADFDGVWNALTPKEQAKVLKLLVARVEYDAKEGTVAVTFHASGIKALAEKGMEDAA